MTKLTPQRLSQQLKKRGYIVDIANHGEEALAHIQKTHFWTSNGSAGKELSVILLDNEMPVMNVSSFATPPFQDVLKDIADY